VDLRKGNSDVTESVKKQGISRHPNDLSGRGTVSKVRVKRRFPGALSFDLHDGAYALPRLLTLSGWGFGQQDGDTTAGACQG
jgi:hypothetical protein